MKLAYVYILIVSLVVVTTAGPAIEPFIVGGGATTISSVPYQASVSYLGQFICGGSVIAINFILSAAHCTHGLSFSWGELTARVGSTYWNSGGQLLIVGTIIFEHDNYDPDTLDYDFALLQLNTKIVHPNAQFVDLPHPGDEPSFDFLAAVSGFGALYDGGSFVPDVHAVEVKIVEKNKCRDNYATLPNPPNKITDQMFCAGLLGTGGADACKFDDGGPLVQNGVLYGVISFRYKCGHPDFPGVYALVSTVRDWIFDITGV